MHNSARWHFWDWSWGEWKRKLIGVAIPTRALQHERLSNSQGLAIFSSDALSSVAYSTEEILRIFVAAGASASLAAFSFSLPIAIAIAALIVVVSLSYCEIIRAYPEGGGVYTVAQKNLGEFWALLGAASLLIDYMLTVSVSVSAGVAAITSAFPLFLPHRVFMGAVIISFITWANLRGVRESGKMFVLPPYIFIVSFLGMIAYGIWRHGLGTFGHSADISPASESGMLFGGIGVLIVLRAFASGCTALTGIEATSNGVQAFREPASGNAAKTLLRMSVILAVVFVGITVLASWIRVVPHEGETVVSQIARSLFGSDWRYFLIQGSTAAILLLAANTPFAGFPRVASQLALDKYFPSQFKNLGSRGVFANGIIALAIASFGILYFFGGNVHALIPLYAVGVFLGFSISQFGMIRHWAEEGVWARLKSIAVNALGFSATTAVFCVVLVSKFTQGAWLLFPAVIFLMLGMKKIRRHYEKMKQVLSLDVASVPKITEDKTVVILLSEMNYVAKFGLRVARSYKPAHIRAVHVWIHDEERDHFQKLWERYGNGIQLDLLFSECRDVVAETVAHLKEIKKQYGDELVVVIPQLIPETFFGRFLHNQTAALLQVAIEQDQQLDCEILEIPVKIPVSFTANGFVWDFGWRFLFKKSKKA